MTFEPYDNNRNSVRNEAKNRFFELVTSLEDDLEKAEKLGHEGSIEMLDLLEDIGNIEQIIEKTAREAGETMPFRNYQADAERLIHHYLPNAIKNESVKIKDSIDNLGCLNKNCQRQINALTGVIDYYGNRYPELGLEKLLDSLDTLCKYHQNVPAPKNKNFFERLFTKE